VMVRYRVLCCSVSSTFIRSPNDPDSNRICTMHHSLYSRHLDAQSFNVTYGAMLVDFAVVTGGGVLDLKLSLTSSKFEVQGAIASARVEPHREGKSWQYTRAFRRLDICRVSRRRRSRFAHQRCEYIPRCTLAGSVLTHYFTVTHDNPYAHPPRSSTAPQSLTFEIAIT
jgi:hypothetical protein